MSPRRSAAATRAQTKLLADRVPDVVEGLLAETPVPPRPHGDRGLVILMGFPGVGKTHVARLLAERLGAAHVASDVLRSRLFVAASYGAEENAAVFRIIDALVERLLDLGHRVLADATHLGPRTRSGVEGIARRRGLPLRHVLVVAEEPEVLARLAARQRERAQHDRSDADERVYRAMRDRGFEAPAVPYTTIANGPAIEAEVDRLARDMEAQWRAT